MDANPSQDAGTAGELPRVGVVLVHAPVYNRLREVVATSVTGADIHDVARVARTYEATPYYIVTPVEAQRDLVARVAAYWIEGEGHRVDHPRGSAIDRIRIVPALADAVAAAEADWGRRPEVIVTSAASDPGVETFASLRQRIERDPLRGRLLVFGTGWGLASGLMESADVRLEPIRGVAGFNHLPVRSAVAIILDRLLGSRLY